MKQLTISIDYDNTFTADPCLWSGFINASKSAGHNIVMITARRDTEENSDLINTDLDVWQCQIPVFFSNLGSKTELARKLGLNVDIWIDDNIPALLNGY